MTSETYFPEQRHLLARTTIRRERLLPEFASGEVTVTTGARVSLRDVVAHGTAPSAYVLVDATSFFKLKHPDALLDLLEVRLGEAVRIGEVLASRGRRKRLLSPIVGKVVDIEQGMIILQETPATIDLEAGLNGSVVGVSKGRGITIESYGAILQGVWGNGQRKVGTLRMEPSEGIEAIFSDAINQQYRSVVVVTRRPLRRPSFDVIDEQSFAGVIAPSMEPDLIAQAVQSRAAILLTEGFGSQHISNSIVQFLDVMEGRQATLDAITPAPLEPRRPEVLINVPLEPGERPSPPNLNLVLQEGREVRVTSGDFAGMAGRVVGLPKDPVLLDNGLRIPCAQVELVTGEKLAVPLANIEVSG